jgi:hypothetical protein
VLQCRGRSAEFGRERPPRSSGAPARWSTDPAGRGEQSTCSASPEVRARAAGFGTPLSTPSAPVQRPRGQWPPPAGRAGVAGSQKLRGGLSCLGILVLRRRPDDDELIVTPRNGLAATTVAGLALFEVKLAVALRTFLAHRAIVTVGGTSTPSSEPGSPEVGIVCLSGGLSLSLWPNFEPPTATRVWVYLDPDRRSASACPYIDADKCSPNSGAPARGSPRPHGHQSSPPC